MITVLFTAVIRLFLLSYALAVANLLDYQTRMTACVLL